MPKSRLLLTLAAGLALSLAAAGCSGDSNSASGSAAIGVDRNLNLSESVARISELKSFRFTLNASIDVGGQSPSTVEDALGNAMAAMLLSGLKDVKLEGAVVAPDQLQLSLKMSGQEFGLVQLGDKAWANLGGLWTPIEPEELGLENGLNFDMLTASALPVEVVQAAKVTKEKVSGVETTRYSFDKAALQSLADDADANQDLETANLDVWLTDDGIPVKIAMKMTGKDETGQKMSVEFNFTMKDINSNVTIKAPM